MIPIILIAAAVIGVTAAVSLTAMFWEDIKQFLKDTLKEVKRLADRFVKGCKVFLRRVKRSFVTLVNVIAYNGPQKSDHCRRKEREHGRIGPTIERKRYHGTQTVQPTV